MPRRARATLALASALAASTTLASCGGTGLEVRGAAPDSSADAITRITGCTGRGEHAPTKLTIRCSNPPTVLQDLKWQGWGGSTATATGRLVIEGCPPGAPRCGGSAHVVASDLVLGSRAAQYEALSVQTGHGAARVITHFDVDDRGPTKR